MNSEQNNNQEQYLNEIDLRKLFSILWKGKWLVIGTTFAFGFISVAIALYLPKEYEATALVQPANNKSSSELASLANQFGGLASLAGVSLSGGEVDDSAIALEIMKSWSFSEKFINKHNLFVPLFAAEGWDKYSNELVLDSSVYDMKKKQWLKENSAGEIAQPTSWQLFEEFSERVSFKKELDSGLITINVIHYSPYIAKEWVDKLVFDINALMKIRALGQINKSIKYIEEQMNNTSIAELRIVFAQLMQEQQKSKMLAQISDEYIFLTVNAAKVAEESVKPRRLFIVASITFFGLLVSMMFLFMRYVLKK